MEITENRRYESSVPQTIVNIGLLLYTILFMSANLIPAKYLASEIHWAEAGVGLILWFVLIYRFIRLSRRDKVAWLKYNIPAIGFMIAGVISFIYNGFAYSIARTVFIESVYLFIITTFMCDSRYIKNVIFKVYIYLNLIMNLLPFLISLIIRITGYNRGFIRFLYDYTFIDTYHATPNSILYTNPNAMGIMTALAILLVIMLYDRHRHSRGKKIAIAVYMIFSAYIISTTGCRSAILALVGAFVFYVIFKFVNEKYAKYLVTIVMIGAVAGCSVLLVYINMNVGTGMKDLTEAERKLATVSSDRYIIWKASYISQKGDSLLLGRGSLKFVEEGRDAYLDNNCPDYFSYKQEDEKTQIENAGMLQKDLNVFTSFIERHNLSGTGGLKVVMMNPEDYYPEKYPPKVEEDQNSSSPDTSETKVTNVIAGLDTHNGYYSVFFCNGLLGFILFIIILFQRIMGRNLDGVPKWYLPIVFLLALNVFESAFIADRFFPVVIMFLILALDGKSEEKGSYRW